MQCQEKNKNKAMSRKKQKQKPIFPLSPILSLPLSLSTFFLCLWLFFVCLRNKAKNNLKVETGKKMWALMFLLHLERTLFKSTSTSHCFWFIIFLNWFLYQIKDQIIFLFTWTHFFLCLFTQYVKCFNNKHQNETHFKI